MLRIPQRLKEIYAHNRSLIYNILGSTAVKGIAVAIGLFTMPAYLSFFQTQSVAGVWLVMLSVLTMISVMDFGLGLGLRNKLTVALATHDEDGIRHLISSSYAIITVIAGMLFGIAFVAAGFLPWNQLFGIAEDIIPAASLLLTVRIIVAAIILQMVLRLVTSILYAQQEATIVSILPVFANVLLLIYVLTADSSADPSLNLSRVAWVYLVTSNLPYLVTTIILFQRQLAPYRPSFTMIDYRTGVDVLRLGMAFFYLSVVSLLTLGTNDVLISYLYESAAVVDYQIYNKIYNFFIMAVNIAMIPLWSAVTKAIAEHNATWVLKLLNLLTKFSFFALIGGLVVIPFMQPLVNFWLGEHAITIEPWHCVPFVVWVTLVAWNSASCTIANGAGWLKAQIYLAPLSMVLKVVFTVLLQAYLEHWIAIPLANVFMMAPMVVIQYIYVRRKIHQAAFAEM